MSIETAVSIATGWVYEEAPEGLHASLLAGIQSWGGDSGQTDRGLWLTMLDYLRGIGCYDGELSACRQALALYPALTPFQVRLADILHRVGQDAEALTLLAAVPQHSPQRAEALSMILSQGLAPRSGAVETAALDELEPLLLADGRWSALHADLVRALTRRDLTDRASAFLRAWTDRWPIAPSQLLDFGVMAMLVGNVALARTLFTPLWRAGGDQQKAILGGFNGVIAPYSDARDAELRRRVEDAFAIPDDRLTVARLWDGHAPPPGLRVVFLTFEDRDLSNDLAWHMTRSAAEAGIALTLHRDSAVVLACDRRASDGHIQERVDAFVTAMERQPPDVLIIDCCHKLTLRGITPETVADLRRRLGIRTVALLRDAHSYTMPYLLAWQPVCDTMVVFEPHAAIFAPEHRERSGNVLVLPVMAQHEARVERPRPEYGLMFIGSVFFALRQALLAILQTEEGLDFTAFTGPSRARVAPDMPSYTALLRRSEAVLNIAAHTPEEYLVTGRVWETIAAGGLLIEQDNPSTNTFLTPYRHYLPWRDLEDIVHLAHFVRRHPDIRARISDEAYDWTRRHYGSARIWAALLGHATRPLG